MGLGVIEALYVAFGFILFSAIEVKEHLIWLSFVILPAVAATFLWFLGLWIGNDYFFYDPKQAY